MNATPRPPLLGRVLSRVWTAVWWSSLTLLVILLSVQMIPPPMGFQDGVERSGPMSVVVVIALASALLSRWPLVALALLLGNALHIAFELPYHTQLTLSETVPALLALCYIAATREREVATPATVMCFATLFGYGFGRIIAGQDPSRGQGQLPVALVFLLAWMIGNSIRTRRRFTAAARAQATEQAITEERLRIARELHDMVAHSIGIIAIQAGVGSRVIDSQPAEARAALQAIEATSRETLSGLRRTLVALRQADPEPGSQLAPLAPAPGLDDLERLAEATSQAGIRVHLAWHGERRPLPGDIDLSAYRIVQEAVTNVVRHAGTRHCRVSIDYGAEELSLEVVDDGRGVAPVHGMPGVHPAQAGAGFGITGMRERVSLLHGEFSAGARPEGGFRVSARLPLPPTSAVTAAALTKAAVAEAAVMEAAVVEPAVVGAAVVEAAVSAPAGEAVSR
ncbi:signal transduction histidine kinase [Streptacidiphilus sp. MAP12-20]|uniref:sensor histidine kinase n=1 Tax=Streptacidiphilus sp. MAP12-20 TaxID=3156299 RepID=UPI003512DB77